MLGSLALRAEKRMVGRAVTSDLGKKLLREYCLPETFVMLEALRELASKDPTLPPRTGQQIENTILKMAVKVALRPFCMTVTWPLHGRYAILKTAVKVALRYRRFS